jgi:hypothetical protein
MNNNYQQCLDETFKWFNDRNNSESTQAFVKRMRETYTEEVISEVAKVFPYIFFGEPGSN